MYLHHNGNHTVLFLKVRALTRLSWAGEMILRDIENVISRETPLFQTFQKAFIPIYCRRSSR